MKDLLSQKWNNRPEHLLIVNFIGAKGSGKDTCVEHACSALGLQPETYNVSFAKDLKDFVWNFFQKKIVDPSRIYGDVSKKEEPIEGWEIGIDLKRRFPVLKQHKLWTGRLLLQWYGTDIMRATMDSVWVDRTMERIKKIQEIDLPILFTSDCRFHDEYKALEDFGKSFMVTNVFVRVDRPSLILKDGHASESNWSHMKHDYQVFNDSDLANVHARTEDIVQGLLEYSK